MMSQVSSQTQDPSWVSIRFEKYSYNNSRIGVRKYTWSHVGPRNDLDFVIRSVRVVDEAGNYTNRMLMKISAGSEVLETQDLGELAACCKHFDPASGGDNPVQVVTRPPIWLAMVYPKTSTTVQRTQFKFFNESDFKRVVSVLTDLRLPIRENLVARASTSSVPPPSSSPAPSMFSATSESTSFSAASSVSRPQSSIQGNTSSNNSALIRHPDSSLFKMPQLPEASGSATYQSILPYSTPNLVRQLPFSTAPTTLTTGGALSAYSSIQDPTKNSSLYLSQMDRESEIRRLSQSNWPAQNISNSTGNPGLSLIISQIHSQRDEELKRETVSTQGTMSPFFSPQNESQGQGQTYPGTIAALERLRQGFDVPNARAFDLERPLSTPTDYATIQNLWIPPRRELPFAKPQPANKNRASSLVDLSPLPKPTPVVRSESVIKPPTLSAESTTTPAAKPTKKRVAQRKAPAAHVTQERSRNEDAPGKLAAKDIVLVSGTPQQEDEPSPLAAKSAAAARPASVASGLQSKATAASKKRAAPARPASAAKRPKMVDQGTQTQTLSGRDHTAGVSVIPSNDLPELDRDASSPASPPESYLDSLDNFITKHKARPAPKELWETPGYSTADQEEREAMLNDFICENLENEDFLQLCKDTELAWRRMGLGM